MSFLNKFKKLLSMSPSSSSGNFVSFKIRCDRCSEEILVKLRKTSDISRVYEEEGEGGQACFFVRKEILGNKCNNLINMTAYFDENFNLISSEVIGGKIVE